MNNEQYEDGKYLQIRGNFMKSSVVLNRLLLYCIVNHTSFH